MELRRLQNQYSFKGIPSKEMMNKKIITGLKELNVMNTIWKNCYPLMDQYGDNIFEFTFYPVRKRSVGIICKYVPGGLINFFKRFPSPEIKSDYQFVFKKDFMEINKFDEAMRKAYEQCLEKVDISQKVERDMKYGY